MRLKGLCCVGFLGRYGFEGTVAASRVPTGGTQRSRDAGRWWELKLSFGGCVLNIETNGN